MDRLAELRERRALTLRELAEMSGVAADTINQIELGHRKARPSTLRKLARALDVEVREFFEEPTLLGKAEAPESGQPDPEEAARFRVGQMYSTFLEAAPLDKEKEQKAMRRMDASGREVRDTWVHINRALDEHAKLDPGEQREVIRLLAHKGAQGVRAELIGAKKQEEVAELQEQVAELQKRIAELERVEEHNTA